MVLAYDIQVFSGGVVNTHGLAQGLHNNHTSP